MWGVESDPRHAPLCVFHRHLFCQLYPGRSFLPKVAYFACSPLSLWLLSQLSLMFDSTHPPTVLLQAPPLSSLESPKRDAVLSLVPFPWWLSWAFLLFSHHYVYPGGGRGGLSAGCPPYSALPSAPLCSPAPEQPRFSHAAQLGSSGVSLPAVYASL